jgi:anti-anti-sigma factor
MLVELRMEGSVAIVCPRMGLIGGPETAELEKTIGGLIQQDNRSLVVDLSHVDALTTRGLAVLVSTHVNYDKRGGRFVLSNPGKGVRNVFRITRIGDILTVRDSIAEALAAFTTP